jgi:signal-transduction protein with cAMP-binding, CBS, and nucleotidyltransferase domain
MWSLRHERATLPQLAEMMTSKVVKRITILRDRQVVGVVSRSAFVTALARTPAMLV